MELGFSGPTDLWGRGDTREEENQITLSDMAIDIPSAAGMQTVFIDRENMIIDVNSTAYLALHEAMIDAADTTDSEIAVDVQSKGRYHMIADSTGTFVDTNEKATEALLREPPDRYHLRFHIDLVGNPILVRFIGDIEEPLLRVLRNVPRAISLNVLRLCTHGQPLGNNPLKTIIVECSRMVCYSLKDMFTTDRVRLYHQESASVPATALRLYGGPVSISPLSLTWMDDSDLSDCGFTHVMDSTSISTVLASQAPTLMLVFRNFRGAETGSASPATSNTSTLIGNQPPDDDGRHPELEGPTSTNHDAHQNHSPRTSQKGGFTIRCKLTDKKES